MGTLDGKVALITGAGSGIGRGTAVRLARDGADVCVVDIDEAGAAETASSVREFGRDTLVVRTNVASKPQVQDAADRCVAELGGIDIAVANAGIARGGSVLDLDLKDWQDQLDFNLTGVFLTVQAAAQRTVRQAPRRSHCLHLVPRGGYGRPGSWGYSATKAGVQIMVRGWARELGQHGITVNAIGPGVIDTPLAHGLAGDAGGPIRQALEQRSPVGRAGRPPDIAGPIAFVSGPDSEFMTGSYVLIDGGLRDARGAVSDDPANPLTQERVRHMQTAAERRTRLQPLIDER